MRGGTVRDRSQWDRLVNERWDGVQPVLSPEDSIKATLRLFRQAMGRPWTGKVRLATGNRRTWVRSGVLVVNPDESSRGSQGGLREIIHSIAHYAHYRLHPSEAPHSRRQLLLESRLVTYAIKSGFAEGRVRRLGPAPQPKAAPEPKPPVDKVVQKHARMVKRRDTYRAQVERLTRLLAKAEREVKDYQRRHKGRVVPA
jgi:hypothetical protein